MSVWTVIAVIEMVWPVIDNMRERVIAWSRQYTRGKPDWISRVADSGISFSIYSIAALTLCAAIVSIIMTTDPRMHALLISLIVLNTVSGVVVV